MTSPVICAAHCFSTRIGGVSTGDLSSLNLGSHRGDVPENVFRNYDLLGEAAGIPVRRMAFTKQVHGCEVRVATERDVHVFGTEVPYEADGLVISTPTGSTAYNLSVGGPLMEPHVKAIILSPIATHKLGVRPLVIPDEWAIDLKITSRNGNYLISVDGRSRSLLNEVHLHIQKAPYTTKVVQLEEHSFIQALKDKLQWGK